LNVTDRRSLLDQPWVGASWEGFVIEQILGLLSTLGCSYEPYHLRTGDGREIDLVLEMGRDLWAIEVKLTASPSADDMRRFDESATLVKAGRRYLVSQTTTPFGDDRRASCNLDWLIERIREHS
jgi:predicted AAA+ superfamily ATPase